MLFNVSARANIFSMSSSCSSVRCPVSNFPSPNKSWLTKQQMNNFNSSTTRVGVIVHWKDDTVTLFSSLWPIYSDLKSVENEQALKVLSGSLFLNVCEKKLAMLCLGEKVYGGDWVTTGTTLTINIHAQAMAKDGPAHMRQWWEREVTMSFKQLSEFRTGKALEKLQAKCQSGAHHQKRRNTAHSTALWERQRES